jgi:hypothetical protein
MREERKLMEEVSWWKLLEEGVELRERNMILLMMIDQVKQSRQQ